ncbi:MAG TPA: hypothetical protein VLQ93_16865 [Myxococcaceae bacterium]|nr:hypothetical protein [Myxococcaceae bacterium]
MMNKKQTLVLGTLLSTALVGCGPEERRVEGQAVDFNGAKVTTWATLDKEGVVKEVGFTLPYTSVENAPAGSGNEQPVILVADFPKEVRETTYIDHFEFDWMPTGHEPARYMTPHFDFHFYGVDKATTAAIDCMNVAQPDPADLPEGWVPPVPPDLPDPKLACAPNMGYHSMPATEFDANGPKAGVFDKVMLAGFYDKKFIFIEPMVTKAELEKKQGFTLPVPQPKTSLGRTTLYPTSFKATFDADANAYEFVLGDFKSMQ